MITITTNNLGEGDWIIITRENGDTIYNGHHCIGIYELQRILNEVASEEVWLNEVEEIEE